MRSPEMYSALVFCLALVLIAGNLEAAQRSVEMEEIVVTPTMTEKKVQKAPGSLEVFTRQDIKEMNAQSVAEVLEEATSIQLTRHCGRQIRPSIRGTGSKHALVLIDGRRISAGYKGYVDIGQIPVDLIERIEVTRGPSCALYGSDAISGVVNVITRKPPRETEAGVTVQYAGDKHGEGEEPLGRAYLGHSSGSWGMFLAGSCRTKEKWDQSGGDTDDGDKEEEGNIGGRFSFDFNEQHSLLGGFEFNDRELEGARHFYKRKRTRSSEEQRHSYFLEYNAEASSRSNLMLRYNHSEHENDISMSPYVDLTSAEDAQRCLDQVQGRYSGRFWDKHLFTMGSEFWTENLEDKTGRDETVDNLGIYLQDEYRIIDPLYLVAGLRYDEHSDFGSEWTPRTSLVYSLLQNLRIKGSYGTGFRAPSLSNLFVTSYRKRGKWIYQPNPDLGAEESESYELGIEGEYKRLQAKITAFRTEVEDLIEPVKYKSTGQGKKKKDYYRYENIAEATLQGVELEYGLGLPLGFSFSGNWTYLDTEDEETGGDIEGRPDYKGLLKLGYQHEKFGFRCNIRMNYTGERYYSDGTEGDYTVFNAHMSQKITNNLEIFANMENMFNTSVESSSCGGTMEPTTVYAGLTVQY